MSIMSLSNFSNASNDRMQAFGGLLHDLLSYHTCKLLYRVRSREGYASFGML